MLDGRPVREFDLQNRKVLDRDPFTTFLEAREMDPFWTDDDGGTWVFTRYDQCREIQQDPADVYAHRAEGGPRRSLDAVILRSAGADKTAFGDPATDDSSQDRPARAADAPGVPGPHRQLQGQGPLRRGRRLCPAVSDHDLRGPLRFARGASRGVSQPGRDVSAWRRAQDAGVGVDPPDHARRARSAASSTPRTTCSTASPTAR